MPDLCVHEEIRMAAQWGLSVRDPRTKPLKFRTAAFASLSIERALATHPKGPATRGLSDVFWDRSRSDCSSESFPTHWFFSRASNVLIITLIVFIATQRQADQVADEAEMVRTLRVADRRTSPTDQLHKERVESVQELLRSALLDTPFSRGTPRNPSNLLPFSRTNSSNPVRSSTSEHLVWTSR